MPVPASQVERFLDTDNAALISMHYPQAQREVHFGTAPFNRGEEDGDGLDEEESDGSRSGEESTAVVTGATGVRGDHEGTADEGYAGESIPPLFPTACCIGQWSVASLNSV